MKNVAKAINLIYAHDKGLYGRNVTVAIVDSGIYPHEDFRGRDGLRIVESVDMVNNINMFYDDCGHGTHVAGILGGAGKECTGVAPLCNFVSVKVLDKQGNGKLANVIRGLEWIKNNYRIYNIRIVNISVGTPVFKNYDEESELIQAVEQLWNLGMIVTAAAGNNGPKTGTIGAPGISRKVITVGASDSNNKYSGRGPTKSCIMKPDIVAPGSNIISCSNIRGKRYSVRSGTSMSTPVVSGAIALLLSKYPEMTNREVKIRLKNCAVDMGLPHEIQGWGFLDIQKLLKK